MRVWGITAQKILYVHEDLWIGRILFGTLKFHLWISAEACVNHPNSKNLNCQILQTIDAASLIQVKHCSSCCSLLLSTFANENKMHTANVHDYSPNGRHFLEAFRRGRERGWERENRAAPCKTLAAMAFPWVSVRFMHVSTLLLLREFLNGPWDKHPSIS